MKVMRSLLLQFEDSMLARMFSGRYEGQLDKDNESNAFFDYSANIMVPLIEHLRLLRDSPPEVSLKPPFLDERCGYLHFDIYPCDLAH